MEFINRKQNKEYYVIYKDTKLNEIFSTVIDYLYKKNYNEIDLYIDLLKSQKNIYNDYICNLLKSGKLQRKNIELNNCIIKYKNIQDLCDDIKINYVNPDILYDIFIKSIDIIYRRSYTYKN